MTFQMELEVPSLLLRWRTRNLESGVKKRDGSEVLQGL